MTNLDKSSRNEADLLASLHASRAEAPTSAEVSSPPPTEAEIQLALRKIRATDHSLAGKLRSFRDPDLKQDLERLLQSDVDDLVAILRTESRMRARRKHLVRWGAFLITIGWLYSTIAMHDFSFRNLFFLYIPVSLLVLSQMASQRAQTSVLAISRFDDVRAIGPLAEALEFPDRDIRPIVRKALIHLLPRLKASDAALLNAGQRACLNRALWGGNTELTLAILKAWEQVGDADAIPDVEQLARGPGSRPVKGLMEIRYRKGWFGFAKKGERLSDSLFRACPSEIVEADRPKIAMAALECLPALRQNVENRHVGSQLLRPAEGDRVSSEALLRPSSPQISAEPPEQLLHPTDTA